MTQTRVVHVRKSGYDVFIGRPSLWGNPFLIGRDGTRDEVIAKYRSYLMKRPQLVRRARKELTGKRLGCFCHPLPCHGDVLVMICNAEEKK